MNDEQLGFHLEDGRFISVPIAFYPTLALATPEERGRFEINGSSVYWLKLDADIGVEGMLAGAREHHFYARKAVERAVREGRLPKTALEKADGSPLHRSDSSAKKTVNKLRAGVVWANTYNKFDPTSPFGGYKESGFGREGGLHGSGGVLPG